eukprot:1182122-Rhodomonas_salina.3
MCVPDGVSAGRRRSIGSLIGNDRDAMRSRLKDVTSVDQLYVQVLADAAKPITRPRDLKTRKVLSVAVDYDILSSDASRNAMVGADVCYVPVPGGGAASRSDPQSQRMGLGFAWQVQGRAARTRGDAVVFFAEQPLGCDQRRGRRRRSGGARERDVAAERGQLGAAQCRERLQPPETGHAARADADVLGCGELGERSVVARAPAVEFRAR